MSIINGAGLNSFRSQFSAGTAYALAEIIDNSIQWKRKDIGSEINIIMIERGSIGNWKLNEILITDNGLGMNYDTINTCLTFGGGKNNGMEENGRLGKFGLGLPYASCSQSPNYHIYSWESRKAMYHTYRDHSEFELDQPVISNTPNSVDDLPREFYELLPELKSYNSGTIVQWKDCDKIEYTLSRTLIKHVNLTLGRIYRHYIINGVKINYLVYRTTDNKQFEKVTDLCSPLEVFDPMFLLLNSVLPEPFKSVATNVPWGGKENTGEKEIVFKETDSVGEVKEHKILLRYSIAKPEIQGPDGKSGGNIEPGKTYYKKAIGISLVRAKRELKLSHFGFPFPNGNSDPRHRWWSVEVQFEPISDTILGVNANKLDARNFRYLSSDDYHELQSNGQLDSVIQLRRILSEEIEKAIKSMFSEVSNRAVGVRTKYKCPECSQVSLVNGKCEGCGYKTGICPKHGLEFTNGQCPLCHKTVEVPICMIHNVPLENEKCPKCSEKLKDLNEEERTELIKILSKDYPEIKDNEAAMNKTISWFIESKRKYFIIFTDLDSPGVFVSHHEFQDKFTIIEVNTQHPFYITFIQPLLDEDSNTLTPLLIFIASWIRTEKQDYTHSDILKKFRSVFGSNLMTLIDNWSAD
jgi:hypothetical protein